MQSWAAGLAAADTGPAGARRSPWGGGQGKQQLAHGQQVLWEGRQGGQGEQQLAPGQQVLWEGRQGWQHIPPYLQEHAELGGRVGSS